MARWMLPVLLVAGQLLYWPVLPLLRGDPETAPAVTGVAVATVIIGAGLLLRRDRPVPALAVVLAGASLGVLTEPTGQQWLVDHDALLIILAGDMIALYSVAVRTSVRTTLACTAVVLLWEIGTSAVQDGVDGELPLTALMITVVVALVVALGRRRARWNAARADAARRLAAAQRTERQAADAERRRLARELHDVTAHHLTSIVVNSSAAEMLGDQRPDLKAEALDFAARTGRETLDALQRLVAVMPVTGGADDEPELGDLAEGFRALGQRITVELPAGEPPPELAAAVYGIAREALTNTLRYAPGGTVLIRWDGAELLVEDDGGEAPAGTAGLGGGRGITGMRERAETVGGTCEAGPRDGGGWRVRARLTGAGGTARHTYGWLRSSVVIDAALVAMVIVVQLLGVGIAAEEGPAAAVVVPVVLAQIVHALPLALRRRSPWGVFAATVLTGLLFPALVHLGVVPPAFGYMFLFGCAAELAAVYTVAARGAGPTVTWLTVPAVALPWGLAMVLLVAADTTGSPMQHGVAIFLVPFLGVLVAVPAAICWGLGHAARRRRDRRFAREEGGVAAALHQAAYRAMVERHRIAVGLHTDVLWFAAGVPGAADRGDISGVLSAAREALTAMRSLLDKETSSSASE